MKHWFENFKESSAGMKYCLIIPLVMMILFLIATGDLDYGYYTFLRIFSFVFLIIFVIAYCSATESFLAYPIIATGAIIILFNPINPISFEEDTWAVFDILSAVIMLSITIFIAIKIYKKPSDAVVENSNEDLGTEKDDFYNSAVAIFGEWERQKKSYEALTSKFCTELPQVLQDIQSIIDKTICEFSDPMICDFYIKESAVARLDFSYYIFFIIYCNLSNPQNKKFLPIYLEAFEAAISDYYSEEITSPELIDNLFADRSAEYDRIMTQSQNTYAAVYERLVQFVTRDLFSDDYFSKSIFLIDFHKTINLKGQLALIIKRINNQTVDHINALKDLAGTYNAMNTYIKELTGYDIEDFPQED